MDPSFEISESERAAGLRVARSQRVAVFVVAYNAEAQIRDTLRRIPADVRDLLECIYVIDDQSADQTSQVARELRGEIPQLQVFSTPYNQGYGGNQKLGYSYAIQQGFDVVVLLHGDGKYAPEVLPRLLAPFERAETMAVLGSRMMARGAAARGGMPLYKRLGNRVLTSLQNSLLGTAFRDYHCGYRAYRVSALAEIPFRFNTNRFHFDTEIIVQLLSQDMKIEEVAVPTYYGKEIRRINGIGYGLRCLATVLRALANRVHLVFHPKYRTEGGRQTYRFKQSPTSLHQYVVQQDWQGQQVVEMGAGHGEVSRAMHERGARMVCLDLDRPGESFPFPYLCHDLDQSFADTVLEHTEEPVDVVLALDVIEHLHRPEHGLDEIKRMLAPGGKLMASTGNVAFVLLRLTLGLGHFNYGRRGILDLTHHRLFTIRSFRRTLEGEGFRVLKVRGFGPPIRDMVSDRWWGRAADRVASWLARLWPSLFSYQFLVEAERMEDLQHVLARTLATGEEVAVR